MPSVELIETRKLDSVMVKDLEASSMVWDDQNLRRLQSRLEDKLQFLPPLDFHRIVRHMVLTSVIADHTLSSYADLKGFKVDEVDRLNIIWGFALHDIGKYACQNLLAYPGLLSLGQKTEVTHKHPLLGYELGKLLNFPEAINQIILRHHLRPDNKTNFSYPDSIMHGQKIAGLSPLVLAAIHGATVIDTVQAMMEHRDYRPDLTDSQIIEILKQGIGSQFDNEIAEVVIDQLPSLRAKQQALYPCFEGRIFEQLVGSHKLDKCQEIVEVWLEKPTNGNNNTTFTEIKKIEVEYYTVSLKDVNNLFRFVFNTAKFINLQTKSRSLNLRAIAA